MIPPAVATWAEPDGARWAKLEEWPEVLGLAGRLMILPAVATWAEPDGASWAKLKEWPEALEAGRFKIVSDLKRRPDATWAAPDGATWPEAEEGGPD
jgi:hypothetical protein